MYSIVGDVALVDLVNLSPTSQGDGGDANFLEFSWGLFTASTGLPAELYPRIAWKNQDSSLRIIHFVGSCRLNVGVFLTIRTPS